MVALAVQYEEKGVAVITEGYKSMPNATGIHTGLLKLLCAPKGAKREKSQKIMKMWANWLILPLGITVAVVTQSIAFIIW